mmetsp:Transcript_1987/g.7138  ORF Transcript_1987/g.7138 Transcript_1987/m.7138 type:complete len:95 (-) Transcript_1987:362-646(-)
MLYKSLLVCPSTLKTSILSLFHFCQQKLSKMMSRSDPDTISSMIASKHTCSASDSGVGQKTFTSRWRNQQNSTEGHQKHKLLRDMRTPSSMNTF